MLRRVAVLVMGCEMIVQAVLAGGDRAEEAIRTDRFRAPSYFVANVVGESSGKRMVENADVIAWVQTRQGRVLFTSSGAYVGMANPGETTRSSASGRKAEPSAGGIGETVVLKAGFAAERAKRASIEPRLTDRARPCVSFFVGPRDQWQVNVPTYRTLVYEQVWDGIDLEYLAYLDRLEFRLRLAPLSCPDEIVMETGADTLQVTPDGRLIASLHGTELHFGAPRAFQRIAGKRCEVDVAYDLLEHDRFGFRLGTYDARYPLVIDPDLTWSSFLGGPGGRDAEEGHAIALDAASNLYITGLTGAADFPTTAGSFDLSWAGYHDVFVIKINSSGTDLVYATYLGGGDLDGGRAIAVNDSGEAYVAGYTQSWDFPTTSGAYQETINGGTDVFVTKLNATGTALSYSTFIGGTITQFADGIAVDGLGYAYVTGFTRSLNFPTTVGAYDDTANGLADVFVTKLGKNGTTLAYSTYLGSDGEERGYGIALDGSSFAYITGYTESIDFPTTFGAFDSSHNGNRDVFVTKLNLDGSGLSYSTFIGGLDSDVGTGIAVDDLGGALVTGETGSSDFPAVPASFDPTFNGATDAFVARVSGSGSSLSFSSYLGGSSADRASAIAVDAAGNAYVAGETKSADFPISPGAVDGSVDTYGDGFVTKINSTGKNLIYSTFLGGDGSDRARGIAVGASGTAYLAGETESRDFPTSPTAFSRFMNGSADVFATALNSNGTALVFSTLVGGSGDERGRDIFVDRYGFTYVTGETGSSGFPTTPGAFGETFTGACDAYVAVFNPNGDDLVYATFLGGSGEECGYGLAVDPCGAVTVTGWTDSADFPTTLGAFETAFQGQIDAFVAKIAASGTHLEYATFLGHADLDIGRGIALDESGNAFVVGYTASAGFPATAGAFDQSFDGSLDAFVTCLNAAGSALIYSTFLGHSGLDQGLGIAVDSANRAVVTGCTSSVDFPTTPGAFDPSHNGNDDVFVTALNAAGTALSYSTFLGGTGDDWGQDIVVDASDCPVITGSTCSIDFPSTSSAFSENLGGACDAFVTRLTSDGAALSYSTFLGGSGSDDGYGIVLDPENRVLVTGCTSSADFPTTAGAIDETFNGNRDAFVSRFISTGTDISYSTYLGGIGADHGYAIASDSSGNVYVTGDTESHDFPTTTVSYDSTPNGFGDAFVSKLFCLPLQPVAITGRDQVCRFDTDESYSIDAVFGATSYIWNVTGDATIVSGQGTPTITVDFATESCEISVTAENASGSSTPQTLAVSVFGIPSQPGAIAGSSTVCAYASDEVYSISPLAEATSYTWSVTGGASITNGQGTPTITLDFAAASCAVSVVAENLCGTSPAQSCSVTVVITPAQPGSIAGATGVCVGDSDVIYSISPVPGATFYSWSVPADADLASGQGTCQIGVDFGSSSGDVSVSASNACGSSPIRSLAVSVETPVTITQQPADVTDCPGETAILSADALGSVPIEFQWYKDGSPVVDGPDLSGSTTDTLVFHTLSVNHEGWYDCLVTNLCGSETTNPAQVIVDGPLEVALQPTAHAQGLDPISFVAEAICARPTLAFDFITLPPTDFWTANDVITIGVDPPPSTSTVIEVTVTDDCLREVATASSLLLVPDNPLYFDLNGDLCNNARDLWQLCPDWRHIVMDDPNGDDTIDIRDFLYINLDDPLSCGSD